jgi:hypothetical protein
MELLLKSQYALKTEAEQLWAIETWKSLDHRSTKGGQSSGKAATPESDA